MVETATGGAPPAPASGPGGSPLFRKLLVALDLTDNDSRVLGLLASLLKAFPAQLVVVHVVLVGTSVAANAADGSPANDSEQAMLTEMRARVESSLGRPSGGAEFKILHGDPAQRLTEFADHTGCDLLVLSSHRRGVLGRLVRGSVSSDVVATSRRSVLVVGSP